MSAAACYLDWAATSAIRPPEVVHAISDYLQNVGATPGRGGHHLAIAAERVAFECRQALARLLGLPGDAARIAFMFNATHAINTALAGVLDEGDALVVTAFDHNAVLRCAWKLARERGIDVRLVPGHRDGSLDEDILARALDGARLLTINAASNVLGTTLDVAALCAQAKAAGVLTLVDTAQVAGELPFDAAASGADIVCVTGHKALLGPQGTGALWAREGIDVDPLLVGGTGGDSMMRDMPASFPDHLQAGTLNAPGIAGLVAGIRFIESRGIERIRHHVSDLKTRLHDGLTSIPSVHILSPRAPEGAPIVTIVTDGIDAGTLAGRLDREHGIMARHGLHCAPETHRLLGTVETGALRLSFGWASDVADAGRAIEAIDALLRPPVFAVMATPRGTGGADHGTA